MEGRRGERCWWTCSQRKNKAKVKVNSMERVEGLHSEEESRQPSVRPSSRAFV